MSFMDAIRSDLEHGYHPKRDDLLKMWLAVTGEDIEQPKACPTCEAEGERAGDVCPDCQGSGYRWPHHANGKRWKA
jgi:hypothetical protein